MADPTISGNNLSSLIGNSMVSFQHLDLSETRLEGLTPETFWNMTSLSHLILYKNGLVPFLKVFATWQAYDTLILVETFLLVPKCLGNMTLLEHLDLCDNDFVGSIPEAFGNLVTFTYLNLSTNYLNDSIPKFLGNMTLFKFIDLHDNSFNGSIPKDFGNMATLTYLDLGMNYFKGSNLITFENLEGPILEAFGNMSALEQLDLKNNKLADNLLEGVISKAHFSELLKLNVLDFCLNKLIFNVSYAWVPRFRLDTICLNSSKLGPKFPRWLQTQDVYSWLDISNTRVSDSIPSWFWDHRNLIDSVNLSNNQLSGMIGNHSYFSTNAIDLSSNQLEGAVPMTTAFVVEGMRKLGSFDVGGNKLSGAIPAWIGETLQDLVILNLRSNHLYGNFPSSLCHLLHLQLLDLFVNNISGSIPKCLNNFFEMRYSYSAITSTTIEHFYYTFNLREGSVGATYVDQIEVMWKGVVSEYGKTLGLVKGIDLSTNMLNGEIPPEITERVGLIYFKLSRNNLSGKIPAEIGNLKSLDFLDLSNNQFSGQIPPTLRLIDRLSVLNLSNNNFQGKFQ
ncbi:receptor-like protein EIX2 [Ziziphus jujuba]|uniref:Receptor-like protein EIX2 n=1 Tax=Ziziphus jujuba TaxID=326968 RepID=A0ABM4A3Z5_ZIZJJ|nr:receptor-like protein EIX2 [Ziziphus jujuba]